MKALIIYFSGTGNTGMLTDEIVSRLKMEGWDTEAVSVEAFDYKSRDFNFHLRTMDLLGFGFPVYKLSYPEIMEQLFPFLANLKPSGKPFFVYSSYCRFASTALHRYSRAMELTGTADDDRPHMAIAMQAFKCPSNGIASLKEPDSSAYREVMYFEPGIGAKLDDFTADILTGYEQYHHHGIGLNHSGSLFDRRRGRIAVRIEKARYPLLSVDDELCIGCGLCAKRCPDDNLFMQKDNADKLIAFPRDAEDCLHCLRCMHICPKKAITFGPLVQGPSRYTPKVRKRLFTAAEALPPGSPEQGTWLVRLRWAAGILCE